MSASSKPAGKMQSGKAAAIGIRAQSSVQLRKDFETIENNEEKYYDRRVYFDGTDEYYPYMFSKTLEHDPVTGFPKKADVESVVRGWKVADEDALTNIATSTSVADADRRKLENVAASQSFNMEGTDAIVPKAAEFFAIESPKGVFEMAEVYAMALLRDVTFADIEAHATTPVAGLADILSNLNAFGTDITGLTEAGVITPRTFMRHFAGDRFGPYISQFLYLPFNYGNLQIEQKYVSESDDDASATMAGWTLIQNGKAFPPTPQGAAKFVHNGRILGAKVHNDPLYQFYYNAALIAFQNGMGPAGFDNKKASTWTSSGGPDVLASVAHVALGALRVAWHNKYGMGMKVRPEVMAQRIELVKNPPNADIYDAATQTSKVPGFAELRAEVDAKIADILAAVQADVLSDGTTPQGNNLLKLQFPEGSPTHPAWPAGHAAVAGACVTVLKAMLNTHDENNMARPWPVQAVHSLDGDSLVNYTDGSTTGMTVVSELDKLAANVSLGRDWAGVHYRCDGNCGIDLGEQYAITYLVDKAKEYHETLSGLFPGFVLEKFDGSKVRITAAGVAAL